MRDDVDVPAMPQADLEADPSRPRGEGVSGSRTCTSPTGQDRDPAYRTALEGRVLEVLATQEAADAQREEGMTLGDRAADRVARAAGSWRFVFTFLGTIALWVGVNSVAWARHWDAYPFILLNFVISVLTAVQAPLIMMSQNRDQDRDREHAEAEFRTSVRAEVLLEHLTAEVEDIKRLVGGQPSS
jgi:uncharacterized membrane protein